MNESTEEELSSVTYMYRSHNTCLCRAPYCVGDTTAVALAGSYLIDLNRRYRSSNFNDVVVIEKIADYTAAREVSQELQ